MPTRLRVGIIFGGPSREREISFAGGRTVFDNLDKRLFAPVPLFLDAHRRLIQLDWSYLYKGTIRDFWPPVSYYPEGAGAFQLSEESLGNGSPEQYQAMASSIGTPVGFDELAKLIDVAFLALHGVAGEDGSIQGMLETLKVPYTGSGLPGSAIGMDKVLQKRLMEAGGFSVPPSIVIDRATWDSTSVPSVDTEQAAKRLYDQAISKLGTPLVVRGANQGSSIGVSILRDPTPETLVEAIDKAFFRHTIEVALYRLLDVEGQRTFIGAISDLRHGVGFPMRIDGQRLLRPDQLQALLENTSESTITLEGEHSESRAVIEGFLSGTEVSTIVLRDQAGGALSLLPTPK